jgi:hypothetical protein
MFVIASVRSGASRRRPTNAPWNTPVAKKNNGMRKSRSEIVNGRRKWTSA